MATTDGTPDQPWTLTTPSGGSEYTAYRDESLEPPSLVVQVGKTQLRYDLRCIEDLHQMLKAAGDWVPLGNADEQKPAAAGTVEAWARAEDNPVGGQPDGQAGLPADTNRTTATENQSPCHGLTITGLPAPSRTRFSPLRLAVSADRPATWGALRCGVHSGVDQDGAEHEAEVRPPVGPRRAGGGPLHAVQGAGE